MSGMMNVSNEREVENAMRNGLVEVVAKLLGEPPKDIYDYGMMFDWRRRAYQWVADQRRPPAIYPVHLWSAGYGGPQSPMTWFRCKTCGDRELGEPHALPERACWACRFDGRESAGWEVADGGTALAATMEAAKGMPEHSLSKVLGGPRA